MQLIPAPGSPELQGAFDHAYVQKIVDILLQIEDRDFFKLVGLFLKNHDQYTFPKFSEQLQSLRRYHRRRRNAGGNFNIPPYLDELVSTLEALYGQAQTIVEYQRGAIVELLTTKLVRRRCTNNECIDNHLFVHRQSRYRSNQIDVAVLSESRQQIEGYTCKINYKWVISPDCTNLTALANKALDLEYDAHVGVVCFDNSQLIIDRIEYIFGVNPSTFPIKAYGLDNIKELEESPFEE